MSSGNRRALRTPERWLAWLLLALTAAPFATAAEWGVDALMRALAAEPPGSVAFREQRWSAYLDVPIVLSGRLTRTPDGRLGKEVTSPEPTTFWIEGDRVRVERPGEPTRELRVESEPALSAFVAGFHATLRGDLATLERHYRLRLTGSEAAWKLELQPIAPQIKNLLTRIVIEGSRGRPLVFEVEEASGDRSRMELGRP